MFAVNRFDHRASVGFLSLISFNDEGCEGQKNLRSSELNEFIF